MTNPALVLVDASSYFFRAYHALPPLENSKGQPLGAVYGVVNMIKRLMKDYQPEHIAIVFDAKGKTFRDEWYPEYKANRPPMPKELSAQFEPLVAILDALGFPIVMIEGVEADDVIGTLARRASDESLHTIISTGDKDMAQLVNTHVSLINTMTDTLLDVDGVIKKFGVKPERIIDYLALIGDKADNVPGVDKVGPKTAIKWLDQYETLDNVMQHADDIGGKVGENLRNSLAFLPLGKKLVTIKSDLELAIDWHQLKKTQENTEQLIKLYTDFEFNSWLRALKQTEVDTVDIPKKEYKTIDTLDELKKVIAQIQQKKTFVFDTETTSLDVMSAELVGISLSVEKNIAYYVPLMHTEHVSELDIDTTLTALKPLFIADNIKKIAQNLKYDMNVLRHYGVDIAPPYFDTMLESYVFNSGGRHDMDSMAKRFLQLDTIKYEDVCGKGAKQISFSEVSVDKATEYAAEDADITLALHAYLYPRVKAIKGFRSVFSEIEMPLVSILAQMEYRGVLIDKDELERQGQTLKKTVKEIEQKAHEIAGESFNLNSPKQLKTILFDKFELPVIKKTPKGQPSTAEPVLQELAYEFELPSLILTFRSLSKLISTYIDALPKRIHPKTGRVHTSYNQAITSTGRLSSSEPNLQNIPVRTKEGRAIRHAFIAPKGYKIAAFDYSQIELRIMAHLSGDKGLVDAFAHGLDIHRATASEVFATPIDKVTDEERRRSKAVNFGLIYGMSAFGLAKQLGVSRGDAQTYIDCYFERYPLVKEYMERKRQEAHDKGFVETLFGRRLYLPDIKASNKGLVAQSERVAINAPMQGTAADIIKKAMIAVNGWICQEKVPVHMIMQVHDELVFEIKEDFLNEGVTKIKSLMEECVALEVPLIVDWGHGDTWEQAH